MSDIVERLRDSIHQCRALDRSQLLAEAAYEVERLRRIEQEYWRIVAEVSKSAADSWQKPA